MESLNTHIVDKIIDFIKSKEIGASASEISRNIDHNRVTVSKYLEVMKAKGVLTNKTVAQAKLWAVSDDHNKPTVLIVDDEKHIVDLVKLSLIPGQYNILEAMDGFTALNIVKEKKPDLILLDLMLPKLDGREVCKILKSQPVTDNIPVIMLTAKSQTLDKVEGLKIGADDYVTKPFDPLELEARVESMLKRSHNYTTKNPVTGLPGISTFMEIAENFNGKMVFIDIKNFKKFNKEYGFKQGNEVLQILARIIKNVLTRKGTNKDVVVHIDNDDFVILTLGLTEQIIYELQNSAKEFLSNSSKGKINLVIKEAEASELRTEIEKGDLEGMKKKAKIVK